MTATTDSRPVVASRRPGEHAFDLDWQVPRDRRGRGYCLWCHLPGQAGDERHPVDAPSLLPPVPEWARELDAAILGERP